jgi:hypothetical protein
VLTATVLLLGAVVFTWPLAGHMTDAVPTGSRPPTVALFGLFTVEWTAWVLEHGGSYWDAPIFHPHRGTFAWSEPQPFTSLATWAVSRITGTVAAYNIVLLAYLVLSGLAGYALARQATPDHVAALWAGLWSTAGAYPISQLAILPLLAGAFPIACLAGILYLGGRPRLAAAGAVALAYGLTWLTCVQFGLLLTVLLPATLVPLFWRDWRWRRTALVAGSLLVGLALALPWLLAQRARVGQMGFERPIEAVRGAYSLSDLFLPARGHWLTTHLLHLSDVSGAYPSDVGVVLLACLVVAVARGGLREKPRDPLRMRRLAAIAVMSATALLLGFGPGLGTAYEWLRDLVPGLDALRTPARFGMFATVGLAALAAAALAFLRGRAGSGTARGAVTAVFFALLVAEMWALPIGIVDPRGPIEDHGALLSWLRDQPQAGALLELPMAQGDGEAALLREVWAARRALVHGRPVANGYSSYFPESYRQLRSALDADPAGRGLRYLEALDVNAVLVHEHEIARAEREALRRALGGSIAFEDGRDTVILLDRERPAGASSFVASSATFRRAPRRGAVLGFSLPPAEQARLLVAAPGQALEISWMDTDGARHTGSLQLCGSVLLDAGAPWFHVAVQQPPRDGHAGRGVLVAGERSAAHELR